MPTYGQVQAITAQTHEPQRVNNWILQISGLAGWTDDFILALKAFPFPKESNARKTIRWFNESRHYAGSLDDFDVNNLQIRDYLDRSHAKVLQDWRRQVWNPETSTIGFASSYKKTGMLYLAPPGDKVSGTSTGSDPINQSRKVVLEGVWPQSFDMTELDMDNDGDNVMITCSLSIDRAYPVDGLQAVIS